jgi:ABC-2 type transport system permease protein
VNSDFWNVARAVAWRNLKNTIARPAVALPPMIIPLVFFATFAGGLAALGRAPGFNYPLSYTSFQFVFVWLQGSSFHGMFSGFLVARDFESGFARRLMIGSPNRLGILCGYMMSTLARAGVGAIIVFGVGFAAGVRTKGDVGEVAGLVGLGLLLTLMASLWSAGVALRLRTIQAGPLMQLPIFLVIFLSPVFVPLALLNGWIKAPAKVNPFTILIEQGRNLLAGTHPRTAFAFGVALAVIVVATVWSVRGLRVAERAG